MKWISIKEQHLETILEWRTSEQVTRFMYTDIEYSLDNQRRWLESIRLDRNSRYWLMEYHGELIGIISITNIQWQHRRGYWNFYIGNPEFFMLAGFLAAYMYNYAFSELGLEKLNGEVLDINRGVRKLHVKQGSHEIGVLEHHIYKNGVWHDVYLFEMTKENWAQVGIRYAKYVAEVEQ
ncbi:UDP-4-amino-4,6-dideoxy-N-acetyl-beta-L-altrosamine N-acetyltransferase [Lysinibacillus sp. B2A1]|nr:UDP-4-amino-4,6-dideoxy-N-acetyl-beta-L-altrosamine N-acetyltransferase [Lysinibacillus sp. B2A1]